MEHLNNNSKIFDEKKKKIIQSQKSSLKRFAYIDIVRKRFLFSLNHEYEQSTVKDYILESVPCTHRMIVCCCCMNAVEFEMSFCHFNMLFFSVSCSILLKWQTIWKYVLDLYPFTGKYKHFYK